MTYSMFTRIICFAKRKTYFCHGPADNVIDRTAAKRISFRGGHKSFNTAVNNSYDPEATRTVASKRQQVRLALKFFPHTTSRISPQLWRQKPLFYRGKTYFCDVTTKHMLSSVLQQAEL